MRGHGKLHMSKKFGKYVLHETLNEGGMTQIWLATDPYDQVVALRRMHAVTGGSGAPKLFKNGIKVMRKLTRHPNIVGLRDYGKVRGTPFMVLDYINGANLKQLAMRHDTVIDENVSDVIIGIADALDHLHDQGWMHLDLKPENVIFEKSKALLSKEVDFGRRRHTRRLFSVLKPFRIIVRYKGHRCLQECSQVKYLIAASKSKIHP